VNRAPCPRGFGGTRPAAADRFPPSIPQNSLREQLVSINITRNGLRHSGCACLSPWRMNTRPRASRA